MDCTPSAVLWDMDGTIVDTEPLWMTAQRELAASVGVAWSEDDAHSTVGKAMPVSADLMRAKGVDLPADVIIDRLVESVAAAVNRHVPWLPGAYELLANLAWASVPCALVTMAYSPVARIVAATAPPKSLQVVLAGNDVGRGKPHPHPYLEAARLLGVDPKKCVAIEDSLNGALSAESAGMPVLVVPSTVKVPPGPRRNFTDSLSTVTLKDLSDISRRNSLSS
jgi:beta-phosphoglucomutase-like phosphatase (HAD superfamily)